MTQLNQNPTVVTQAMSSTAGFGLRTPHITDVLETQPKAGFLEVHTENYFPRGGRVKRTLDQLAEHYPLSFHGVALSLGSTERPDPEHLKELKRLVDTYNPALVSEHISWSMAEGAYLNDLLPLPYTGEALDILCRNIDILQNTLGRQVLIENPSAYLAYNLTDMMDEGTFIQETINRTGCGFLLDVNNIFVTTRNMGINIDTHLKNMPFHAVQEIHLAGHTLKKTEHGEIRIDTHSTHVCKEVWQLYAHILQKTGQVPTLIEWDDEIPTLDILLKECHTATKYLTQTVLEGEESHVA